MRRACVLLCCGLAACAELAPIEKGSCGNGIVEPASLEDCDTFAPTGQHCAAPAEAHECRFVCDKAECPADMACGADGLCRRPAGQFEEVAGSPYSMAAMPYTIGDLDDDGNPDLLGASPAGIAVRFGSAQGQFVASYEAAMEIPWGRPPFGDVDGDGRVDVVVPLDSGAMLLLGQTERSVAPVAFAQYQAVSARGTRYLPIRPGGTYPPDDILSVTSGVPDPSRLRGCETTCKEGDLCLFIWPRDNSQEYVCTDFAAPGLDELAGRIPVASLSRGDPRDGEAVVLAFEYSDFVYVLWSGWDEYGRAIVTDPQELPLPGTIAEEGAQLGDVDGDGALDLLVSIVEPGKDQPVVAVALGDGDGGLRAAEVDPRFDSFIADDQGGIYCFGREWAGASQRWPLAVRDFNGDGRPDYVTTMGVAIDQGGELCPLAPPADLVPWREATVADFNGDGFLDVAAISGTGKAIDFRIGDGTGLFASARAARRAVPVLLRGGDFDGDRLADLAVVERGLEEGKEVDSLAVLFGDAVGAPSADVLMGRFGDEVTFLEPVRFGATGEFIDFDPIDDVLLLQKGTIDSGILREPFSVLIGSTSRALIAPLMPEYDPTDPEQLATFGAGVVDAVIGRFAGADAPLGMVSVVADRNAHVGGLWVVAGSPGMPLGGANVSIKRADLDGDAVCGLDIDPGCTSWTAGDLDGDGQDEVIGFYPSSDLCPDSSGYEVHALVFRAQSNDRWSCTEATTPFASYRAPRTMSLADIDRDGRTDWLVTFVGNPQGEGSATVALWGASSWFDEAAQHVASAVPVPAEAHPRASVALDLDGDAALEVAVAAEEGVVFYDLADGVFAPLALASVDPAVEPRKKIDGADSMLSADVNHDGLADLVVGDGFQVHVLVAVPAEGGAR